MCCARCPWSTGTRHLISISCSKHWFLLLWWSLAQYLSPVFHLLIPICQTFASLLLLSQGFLSLSTKVFIFNNSANPFASFRGDFIFAGLLRCILLIGLSREQSNSQYVNQARELSVFVFFLDKVYGITHKQAEIRRITHKFIKW